MMEFPGPDNRFNIPRPVPLSEDPPLHFSAETPSILPGDPEHIGHAALSLPYEPSDSKEPTSDIIPYEDTMEVRRMDTGDHEEFEPEESINIPSADEVTPEPNLPEIPSILPETSIESKGDSNTAHEDDTAAIMPGADDTPGEKSDAVDAAKTIDTTPKDVDVDRPAVAAHEEVKAELRANFEPYKEKAAGFSAWIGEDEDSWDNAKRIPGHITSGYAFDVIHLPEEDAVIKLPYDLDSNFDRDTTAQEELDAAVEAHVRGRDVHGLEQMTAFSDSEPLAMVCPFIPGKIFDAWDVEDREGVPDEHIHNLVVTLGEMQTRGLAIKGVGSNFIYDPQKGFTIIDYEINEQSLNSRLHHMTGVFKEGHHGKWHEERGQGNFNQDYSMPAYIRRFRDQCIALWGEDAGHEIDQAWELYY